MKLVHEEFAGAFGGSVPALPSIGDGPAESPGRDRSSTSRYETHPTWGMTSRSWEAAETTRLNRAHWQRAQDQDINTWLAEQLVTLRARSTHECKNNGMLAGVANSLQNDVVGPDGPMLEVQSDDRAYNAALEEQWRTFFTAPTFRPNLSGASLLRLWVLNLCRSGEFLAIIATDRSIDGPVQMRLWPRHPRRLASPYQMAGNPRMLMGVEHDAYDRPTRYWFREDEPTGYGERYVPYSPDDVIHEFVLDEEGQARGFPWFTPSLPAIADLRDFDDQVQDASRQMADQSGMLYTISQDVKVWTVPETTDVERRTFKMAPPGWQPWVYPATAPPVQYPDYRAEKHRDMGRPFSMPLLMVRLDASKHNYSSARFDSQGYYRMVEWIQNFMSGTPESCGTLNRLVDLVGAEARFSVPALRRRPTKVIYLWTWPGRPHVDPLKETGAEGEGLETQTDDLISALARRGQTIERHVQSVLRAREAYVEAGLPMPAWMEGGQAALERRAANTSQRQADVKKESDKESDDEETQDDRRRATANA